jgi:hypothetical protein
MAAAVKSATAEPAVEAPTGEKAATVVKEAEPRANAYRKAIAVIRISIFIIIGA